MFGDFFQNFGLQFPFAGLDQQGGMFAALQAPEPSAQQQPGMENKSPSPPGAAQVAGAPQPKPDANTPLASPLQPTAQEREKGIGMLKEKYDPQRGFSRLSVPNAEAATSMAASPLHYGWRSQYPWTTGPLPEKQ